MINKDIKLTHIADVEKKDKLVRMLVNDGISYLEKWEKVSLFRRKEFGGAKEICVIYINENQKERASEILAMVERGEDGPIKHRKKIKALLDQEKKKPSSEDEDEEFFDEED